MSAYGWRKTLFASIAAVLLVVGWWCAAARQRDATCPATEASREAAKDATKSEASYKVIRSEEYDWIRPTENKPDGVRQTIVINPSERTESGIESLNRQIRKATARFAQVDVGVYDDETVARNQIRRDTPEGRMEDEALSDEEADRRFREFYRHFVGKYFRARDWEEPLKYRR